MYDSRSVFADMKSRIAFKVIGTQSHGDLLPRDPRVIKHLEEAFGWARAALNILVADGVFSWERLIALLSDREDITTSSCFSGVGAPEMGQSIVEHVCKSFLEEHGVLGNRRPVRYVPVHACEMDARCQHVLLALPRPPPHIFSNICDFIPEDILNEPADKPGTREKICTAEIKRAAWCVACGKECEISAMGASMFAFICVGVHVCMCLSVNMCLFL